METPVDEGKPLQRTESSPKEGLQRIVRHGWHPQGSQQTIDANKSQAHGSRGLGNVGW